MNKSQALGLTASVTVIVTLASPVGQAADATKTVDKTERALTAAEQIAARLKRLGDKLGQPAPSAPAVDGVTAAGNAGPGVAAAPQPADGGYRSDYDPLAPPKRLVGVHGVKLGGSIAESNALLEQRGWEFVSGGDSGFGQTAVWRKGNMDLNFKADRRGRIDKISFQQQFKDSADGQFDIAQVRQELIARYGPPMFDVDGKDRYAEARLQWSESPFARSYQAMTSATQPQKDQIIRGPRLDANVNRSSLRLSFNWGALGMQVTEETTRKSNAEADNAPKKKAALE